MKNKSLLILTLVLFLLFTTGCRVLAAETAEQQVTINIAPINKISVSSGTVVLDIDSASAGSGPVSDSNTNTTMAYTTNQSNKKITAELLDPFGTGIKLEVEVDSGEGSNPGSKVLSTTPKDIVTNLGNIAESGQTITYTANVTVEATPNSDTGNTKDVIFTLTDQA